MALAARLMGWRRAGGAAGLLSAALVLLPLSATVAAAQAPQRTRPLAAFPGLARLFHEAAAGPADEAAARLFDFEQVLTAVTARPDLAGHALLDYRRAFAGELALSLPADRAVLGRDDTAYRLLSLAYSPKEIADILAGRISRTALDTARKLLMVGRSPGEVSDFLDREYRHAADARMRGRGPRALIGPRQAEELLAKYADANGVERRLVRAVIACESGWNQEARSRAGAIGLMQLMPGTARELGVDAFDTEQNVAGGIRYLSMLLRAFGTVEGALIAYNAGPGFARRLARGETALYGETREFVKRVLALAGK